MGKIQSEMTSDFTMVHNAFIKDRRINSSEKGVLLVMLQKPAGYRFTIRGLANEMRDGVTSITTSIHNLKKFGYVKDKRVVINGRFAYNDYDYCDEPIFKTEFNDPEKDNPNHRSYSDIAKDTGDIEDTENPDVYVVKKYDVNDLSAYTITMNDGSKTLIKTNTNKVNIAPNIEPNNSDEQPPINSKNVSKKVAPK